MYYSHQIMLKSIETFKKDQTLTNLDMLKKMGIKLKALVNNEWVDLNVFTLPLGDFIPLYDDTLNIYAIGVY